MLNESKSDHQLRLASIEWKRNISSLQRQLNEVNSKWKESEIKYQQLLLQNIELKKKSGNLNETITTLQELNGDNKHKLSEMESICDTLQRELKETTSEYNKQTIEIMKFKENNDKLNNLILTTERRSDQETCKLKKQLMS